MGDDTRDSYGMRHKNCIQFRINSHAQATKLNESRRTTTILLILLRLYFIFFLFQAFLFFFGQWRAFKAKSTKRKKKLEHGWIPFSMILLFFLLSLSNLVKAMSWNVFMARSYRFLFFPQSIPKTTHEFFFSFFVSIYLGMPVLCARKTARKLNFSINVCLSNFFHHIIPTFFRSGAVKGITRDLSCLVHEPKAP